MFHVIPRGQRPPASGVGSIYLQIDHWNDYSFVTMFHMSLHDEQGDYHDIGEVKIGFAGQTTEQSTYSRLPQSFERVGAEYFSLGQSVDFYKKMSALPEGFRRRVLDGLADIVIRPEIIPNIENEEVFGTSLLRGVSLSVVKGQFARVLEGAAERTDFSFSFYRSETPRIGGVELNFDVTALSTPSTNIHAIIGRNGVGKTTLLNGMVSAITEDDGECSFVERSVWGTSRISRDYFSSLVSVSFSAFDPFDPPQEQSDPARGTCYFYIGLKAGTSGRLRDADEMRRDLVKYLVSCFNHSDKTGRWVRAIEMLGSDENFFAMNLLRLKGEYEQVREQYSGVAQSDSSDFQQLYLAHVDSFLKKMSSGHAVVLLTVTYLVARVEEKTLVLIDEPESHLHPPLLSAFVRALSDLLHDRNGVAIVATHSPVVLQEVPRSCVWKLSRVGLSMSRSRPSIETFAENVGTLTSEVFGLEVERSGFHALLAADVANGGSFDDIIRRYGDQLGFEGRSILRVLIASRSEDAPHAPS